MALPPHLIDEITKFAMTGGFTIREMASEFGISRSAMSRIVNEHAVKHQPEIKAEVRERAYERAIQKAVSQGIDPKDIPGERTDNEIIDLAAENASEVLLRHRRQGKQFGGSIDNLIALTDTAIAALSKRMSVEMYILDPEDVKMLRETADVVSKLGGTYSRVVATERTSHGLNEDTGVETFEERMAAIDASVTEGRVYQ